MKNKLYGYYKEKFAEGVRQGCGLSPLLFISHKDAIMKRWGGGTTEEYHSTEI
jgi:hypothetical protein